MRLFCDKTNSLTEAGLKFWFLVNMAQILSEYAMLDIVDVFMVWQVKLAVRVIYETGTNINNIIIQSDEKNYN